MGKALLYLLAVRGAWVPQCVCSKVPLCMVS